MDSDYLAHLVSQFSTFLSTYSLFSFISSFALLLSWLFKVWNSSMMRSASDSTFRNVFCFQRGLLQRGALLFKGGSYTVLGFLHPIRGTNPPARGFSVLRKLQSSIGTNQGNKRFHVSLVLVTAWEGSVITSQHTHTGPHTCLSPRMVKWSIRILTANVQHWGTRFINGSTRITSQLNRKVSTKHRVKIRKGIRNGMEQTLHFQNMCFLEFISL